MVLVTITIWGLWKLVAALWGTRMVLRCIATLTSAPADADWRVTAWRCQWELLGYLIAVLASAATLHMALLPGPAPDRLWPIALILLAVRAAVDIPPLLATCREQIEEPLRSSIRWRLFLLRLWRRKAMQRGLRYALVTAPRNLLTRRTGRG